MNKAPRKEDILVETSAGMYCPAGQFYIDPVKKVERALITHAHADHARAGMGHYWTSVSGAPLVRKRVGHGSGVTALPFGERFSMGAAVVSFHPAGHVLGSAQIRIEHGGQVWVVSGDYKRDPDPSCEPFEPVACDVFVTECSFAAPQYVWPEPSEIVQRILDWWDQCRSEARCALLCTYALGKSQRVLAELAARRNTTAYLHRNLVPMVKLYRQAGVRMLETEPVDEQVRFKDWAGQLVLAPPGVAGTPWIKRFEPCSLAFASGWMGIDGGKRSGSREWEKGFVLSDHADWEAILKTIEQTGARRVLAMHGHTGSLIDELHRRGIQAEQFGNIAQGFARDAAPMET